MRRSDWQSRLEDTLDEWRQVPFVPGETDCAYFAADCVQAVTGEDYFSRFRGQYNSMREAAELVRNVGGYDRLFDVLRGIFGEPVGVTYAQRGDLMYMLEGIGGPSMGVCVGEYSFFKSANVGLAQNLTINCDEAFRVY